MDRKKGKVIAAFGIPGSGKSTTVKELGKLLNIKTFHEPEEKHWANAVMDRHLSGNFTAIMWFRSIRVPMLFQADQIREKGGLAIVDSFYDKLFSLYISSRGIQWLYNKNDVYFDEMKAISSKDYYLLPDADYLIFFKIDFDTWSKFIQIRDRVLDNNIEFQKQCFSSQEPFFTAARKYAKEKNCELIVVNQKFSSPKETAKRVADILMNKINT